MSSKRITCKKKRLSFDELQQNVISKNICTNCGACFLACPLLGVLDYNIKGPSLVGECSHCGLCLRVCPRYNPQIEQIERALFGRERKPDEIYGISRSIYVTRSTSKKILIKCQDGGLVTTLLSSALNSKSINGAAISGLNSSNPWLPKPLLATKFGTFLENAGTRYSYSPNLLAFKDGVTKSLKKIAFVGTPCQILALRRIQKIPIKKYSKALSFIIGLFCSESFSYNGLMINKIQNELGIDLKTITKMNIKGSIILNTKNGKTVKISLKEAKKYAEPQCSYCNDFSAEFADISVGGVGLNGWTFAIIRTEKGEEVFQHAFNEGLLQVKSVYQFESAFNLLKKLSNIKKKKSRTQIL